MMNAMSLVGPGRRMNIEFASNLDDVVAFGRYHLTASPTGRRNLRIRAGVTGIACAGAFAGTVLTSHLELDPLAKLAVIAIAAVSGTVVGFAYRGLLMKSIANNSRRFQAEGKNKGVLGWHRLSIMERTLREESEAGTSETTFEALERIAETPTHVFVYTAATAAHVIPRNTVTQGDLAAFVDELKRKMGE